MRGHLDPWIFAVLALGLAGCASRSPPVTYYHLTSIPSPPAEEAPAAKLAGKIVGVGPITVPDVVQLSRPTEEGLQVEEFHRWGGSLERELGRALVLQLSQRLGNEQVVSYPWLVPFRPDYQVVVDVLVFAVDAREQAALDVRWSVLSGTGDDPPRIRASVFTQAVEDPTPAGRAAALRRTVNALAEEIATQLMR